MKTGDAQGENSNYFGVEHRVPRIRPISHSASVDSDVQRGRVFKSHGEPLRAAVKGRRIPAPIPPANIICGDRH